MFRLTIAGLILAAVALPARAGADLIATNLYGKSCQLVETSKSGASTRRCPGVNGYALLVHEHDGRTSVDVVAPDKETYQLDFWEVLTPGLSNVGRMAEWQVSGRGAAKALPMALLVRLNTIDQSNPSHPKVDTMLTVTRVERDGACVIFKIDARAKNASAQARDAAADADRKCLGAYTASAD